MVFYSKREIARLYSKIGLTIFEKQVLEKYVDNKNFKVLDLFCGSGRVSVELAKQGFNVVGLDKSKVMISNAMLRASELGVNVDFVNADFFDDIDLGIFDIVLIMFSVQSFSKEKAELMLDKCSKLLKTNGLLIASFHNICKFELTTAFPFALLNKSFRFKSKFGFYSFYTPYLPFQIRRLFSKNFELVEMIKEKELPAWLTDSFWIFRVKQF